MLVLNGKRLWSTCCNGFCMSTEHNSPLSLLFCFVVIQLPLVFFPAVLLFVESEGVIDDLYYRSNVVTGSVGDDKLTKAEQGVDAW